MEIIAIISLILNVIAFGLIFWLKKEQKMNFDLHDGDIEAARHAYNALMEDFTNYQLEQGRYEREETAKREIRFDNIARSIRKNDSQISNLEKTLPDRIGTFISQVEFAQDKFNNK